MSPEPDEKLAEGTLISHLLELRSRLMRAMIAILIALIPCAYYQNTIFTFVAQPLIDRLPKGVTLIATNVMAPFMAPFTLALFVALFIAMPYVLYQIWAFVAPGLYKHEKKFAIPLLVSSVLLFYGGVAFAYKFVFPAVFKFFVSTTPKGVTMSTDISSYLSFVVKIFFGFGLAFEVPIAVVLLVITGLVSLEKLRSNRGYVLIGIFIIAAALTPPDAISMSIMAIPMYLLYEGGLIMAYFLAKMRREQAEREEEEQKRGGGKS
ncbi:MAG TPA: twin-arginine translocase subunit TatC [Steroidobacteraceae bacterium]|nr:twin-arginine translocase subunit TatC [Steroidobacteraceae bacterium]